jgi:hypothetical protein
MDKKQREALRHRQYRKVKKKTWINWRLCWLFLKSYKVLKSALLEVLQNPPHIMQTPQETSLTELNTSTFKDIPALETWFEEFNDDLLLTIHNFSQLKFNFFSDTNVLKTVNLYRFLNISVLFKINIFQKTICSFFARTYPARTPIMTSYS